LCAGCNVSGLRAFGAHPGETVRADIASWIRGSSNRARISRRDPQVREQRARLRLADGQKGIRRSAVQILREAAWAPALVLAVYLLTARVLHLYTAFPDLDMPMHLVGGIGAAFFFLRSLQVLARGEFLGKPNRLAIRLLAFSLTSVAAIAWEMAEFGSDRLLGTREQLGLEDTMVDLMLGGLGALLLVWLLPETRTGHES
jgi:hypothetical protein